MDDFSRYIIAWQLCRTMKAEDVKNTLDMAIAETGVEQVQGVQRPRLLSDNGAGFISHELKKYLETHEIRHVRTKVYHPLTRGKIECCHRSMKNLILGILKKREKVRNETMKMRRELNRMAMLEALPNGVS